MPHNTKRPRGALPEQQQQGEDEELEHGAARRNASPMAVKEEPSSSAGRPSATAAICCQVPGCRASLAGAKQYYRCAAPRAHACRKDC